MEGLTTPLPLMLMLNHRQPASLSQILSMLYYIVVWPLRQMCVFNVLGVWVSCVSGLCLCKGSKKSMFRGKDVRGWLRDREGVFFMSCKKGINGCGGVPCPGKCVATFPK